MTTIPDLQAAQLAEARDILARRGNKTDQLVFDSLSRHVQVRDTYVSSAGVTHKRRKIDIISDMQMSDELALILSYSLGRTQSFWSSAAVFADRERDAA